MTDQQRTEICPTASDPVGFEGDGGKTAGSDIVKKGLKKAKLERASSQGGVTSQSGHAEENEKQEQSESCQGLDGGTEDDKPSPR